MKSQTKHKVLAVLAGGLVLGVGAATTMAAWNDSEYATTTFTSGVFNLEGSTVSASSGYSDHANEGTAAKMTFSAPFDNLTPGDVVYAPFWLRLSDTTTVDAVLTANAPHAEGANVEWLSYKIYQIPVDATCDAAAAANGDIFAAGETLSLFEPVDPIPLATGDAPGSAGAPVQLCFEVMADPLLVPGMATTATWSFAAAVQ